MAAILLGLATGQAASQAKPSPTVVVVGFTNSALVDHEAYEPLAVGLIDLLSSELQQNPSIRVVDRARLTELLKEQDLGASNRVDAANAARIGKILGAQYVITGGFLIDTRRRLRLDARAVSVETTAQIHAETVTGDADDILDLAAKLAGQLNKGMKLPAYRAQPTSGGRSTDEGKSKPTLKNVMTYSTAVRADENGNRQQAVSFYRQFLGETPSDSMVHLRQRAEQRLRALAGG